MHHPFGIKIAAAGLAVLALMSAAAPSCRAQAGYPDRLRVYSDNGAIPFRIGTAVILLGNPPWVHNGYKPGLLTNTPRDIAFQSLVSQQFNQIEPENELKMQSIWTKGATRVGGHYVAQTNLYDKDGPLSQLCAWAEAQSPRMTVRGHAMVYNQGYTLPTFPTGQQPLFNQSGQGDHVLNKAVYSPQDMREMLESYVRQVVDATMAQNAASRTRYHYKVVEMWDVTNEVVSEVDTGDPEFPGAGFAYRKMDVWYNNGPSSAPGFGYDYIADVYRWADTEMRQDVGKTINGYTITRADRFELYYNEYNLEWKGSKTASTLNLVRHARASGGRVDGLGLQAHVEATSLNPQFDKTITDAIANKLRFAITEADCAINEQPGGDQPSVAQQEINQGNVMGQIMQLCVNHARSCDCFQVWGATDDGSWITNKESTPITRWVPDTRPGPTHGVEGYWPKEGQMVAATLIDPATGKLDPSSAHNVSNTYDQMLAALKSKK